MNCYQKAALVMIGSYEWLKSQNLADEDMLMFTARHHKDFFFSVTCEDSGLMSPAAYNNHISGNKHLNAHEHFHSRTNSSVEFMRHCQSGRFRLDRLNRAAAFIKSRARVHTVTRKENTDLIPIQNGKDTASLHWRQQYALIGISKMVDKPNLSQKYIYKIDGTVYYSAIDAAIANGCSTMTLNSRCINDKRRKYPNWIREEKVFNYV